VGLTVQISTPVHLLVLIGGGEFPFGETGPIGEYLLSHLPADSRSVAFLPTASGSPEYAAHIGKYFRDIDASIDTINVPVYRGRDNRRPKNLEQIAGAGLVYLGGGDLFAALMTELVFDLSGTAGFDNCSGCGMPFAPRCQPTLGIRHYCPECGRREANRQAQARFRANHKGYFARRKRSLNR